MPNPVMRVHPMSRSNPDLPRGTVLDPDNPDHWVRAGRHCIVLCPACDQNHSFEIEGEDGSKPARDSYWTWDGNMEAPSFEASMLVFESEYNPRCHSFLRAGKWEFLTDCTHDMAGQKDVPMVPLPDHLFSNDEDEGEDDE